MRAAKQRLAESIWLLKGWASILGYTISSAATPLYGDYRGDISQIPHNPAHSASKSYPGFIEYAARA